MNSKPSQPQAKHQSECKEVLTCLTSYPRRTKFRSGENANFDALKVACGEKKRFMRSLFVCFFNSKTKNHSPVETEMNETLSG